MHRYAAFSRDLHFSNFNGKDACISLCISGDMHLIIYFVPYLDRHTLLNHIDHICNR